MSETESSGGNRTSDGPPTLALSGDLLKRTPAHDADPPFRFALFIAVEQLGPRALV